MKDGVGEWRDMVEVAVLGALAAGLGVSEQVRLRRARAQVPVRVHVNGTRGKSTVTRLLMGALLASGVRALGKVTGTEARWLLPDGSEEPVRRPGGRATIREQAQAVARAARWGCQAAVLECMALQPELLWCSEHRMIQSTLGVITNAGDDHGDVMGRDRAQVARTLANTIPVGGILVTGDREAFPILAEEARRRQTQAYLAPPLEAGSAPAGLRRSLACHAPENLGVAMRAARLLGVPEEIAWWGFARALPEPGTARWTLAQGPAAQGAGDAPVLLIDALAANDPDAFQRVLAGALQACPPGPEFALWGVYHHRADRAQRVGRFRQRLPEILGQVGGASAIALWATGDPGGARLLGNGARQGPGDPGALLKRWGVGERGPAALGARPTLAIVAFGNTRGARGWQAAYSRWQGVPLAPAAAASGDAVGGGGAGG